jgi:hypothetical protein
VLSEIQEQLRTRGIDLRNKTVTVPYAREQVYKQVRQERQLEEQQRRATQLSTDMVLRNRYFDQIEKEVQKFEDSKTFHDFVNKNIQSLFEDAYLKRLDTIYKKS